MKDKIEYKKLKIADYEVIPIPTGEFGLDGGAMFGTVPKVLWEKSNPADEQNRIRMEARALLLKKPGCNILIDCGNGKDFVLKYGDKLGPKFAQMYNVDENNFQLEISLKKAGIKFADINHVILTHLHFDHAGGGTIGKDGELQPTFPNAQYYVQAENLKTARSPNIRERASYFSANFEPLLKKGCLKLLDGPQDEILPNISLLLSYGHTLGQQIVKVSDQNNTLYYCADLVPTASHVRTAWIMGYDLSPLVLIEEKKKILTQAALENAHLFFEHDPYCDSAQIETVKDDFAVKQRFHL